MRYAALSCALLMSLPVSAAADGFCDMLKQMVASKTVASTDDMVCSTSQGVSGTVAQHCRWPFAFRAPAAEAAFEKMSDDVAACLNAPALPEEGGVNHPDSYDQRLFRTPEATVSVALKDKGALQQTFVFLRVEPANR